MTKEVGHEQKTQHDNTKWKITGIKLSMLLQQKLQDLTVVIYPEAVFEEDHEPSPRYPGPYHQEVIVFHNLTNQ